MHMSKLYQDFNFQISFKQTEINACNVFPNAYQNWQNLENRTEEKALDIATLDSQQRKGLLRCSKLETLSCRVFVQIYCFSTQQSNSVMPNCCTKQLPNLEFSTYSPLPRRLLG
ncbi:hypothetical protein V8G54_031516 [Vigna mungo]|uniref:Uncharacterized protein n=1 Tax=Vigna mungo TaxID=3915 RepID=A0AAQ3RGZ3_VIGMU